MAVRDFFFGMGQTTNLQSYSVDNSTFNHDTIINVTSKSTGGNGDNGVAIVGTAVNGNIEYNKILGVHNLGGSEPSLFVANGLNFNLSYNVFINWTGFI